MTTEEEAREAEDREEVQSEAMDLEPLHMQAHLDSKLSTMEIKDVGKPIDSTEGMLNTPEDQVLVEAPSEIKLPQVSSQNGHMGEQNNISNEQQHEDNKKDHHQVQAVFDGENTGQSSKINKEVNDCLSHGEATTEDSSLLKHEKDEEPKGDDQQDEPMPDTLKADSSQINKEVNDCLSHEESTTEDSSILKHEKEEEPKGDDQHDEEPMPDTLKADSNQTNKEVNDCLSHGEATTEDSSLLKHEKEEEPKGDDQQDEEPMPDTLKADSNQTNKEVNDCLNHGEATTEDSSLLKHEKEEEPKGDDQQDEEPMPDTLKADSNVDQRQIVIDRLNHDLDLANATVDTQPASMANIPHVEVVAEALAGAQSPLDSDAIRDTIDGSTEKDGSAREDSAIHLEHRKSFPEDTSTQSTAKHTEEVVKAEDQQSKQDGTMDADVQDDIPKCQDTGVSEEIPKSEHADESTVHTHEVLHQEPSEETNGPAYEKKEQTSQQSSMAASDDTISEHDETTCEPPVDIQEQKKESLQDSVETNNTEISGTHNVKDAPSSEEDKMENDNVTAKEPTSGGQEVDNAGSTEGITENIAENILLVSNVATTDEANKENNTLRAEDTAEKHMQGIEPEVTKNTESVETEEDSDQRCVSLLDDSAQEDNTPLIEKQHTESALEINETEATRTEAVPEESNASVSEEVSPEDYVTENETTRDAKEVNTTETLEAIEGDKNTQIREISNQSNMDSAGESPQENNAATSELHVMESERGTSNIEATEEQATLHQIAGHSSEEKATEEIIASSEPQILESSGKINDTEANKTQSIPQQSIISPSKESVTEEIAKEDIITTEPDEDHQQTQDPQLAELDKIETKKSREIASSSIASNYEEPTLENDATVIELNPATQAENLQSAEVMEDTENVRSHGSLAGEAALEENVETNASVDISSVLEPELEEAKNTEPVGTDDNIMSSNLPVERMERDTMETEATPHGSPVTNITEVNENDGLTSIAQHAEIQPVLEQESVEDKCTTTTEKPIETHEIVVSASDELTPIENNTTMEEPACGAPLQNDIAQGIKDSEDDQSEKLSNLNNFPTPGEVAEESKVPRIEPTSDGLEVQELSSTEETKGLKAAETEDHQQHIVSTLQEPAVDNMPNVNDYQDSDLLKAEDASHKKFITLEDTAIEDIADETDATVGIEQEHELEPVEGDKDINANKAKQDLGISHGENITHVQDKDISGEPVTERGTVEAPQALIENDTQASQDVMEKDDTIKSGEQTNDQRQFVDVEHRPQTFESSAEDEAVQKVSLDERHKDQEVETQKQQLTADEQKHKDESNDVSTEPLLESKSTENGTTNMAEETDTLEAGQTEAMVNETIKNGQTLHTLEESTPSTTDAMVEDIMGMDKGVEEETRPHSANTSNEDAKMDNQEDQENTGKDNRSPMDSTGEHDEKLDEIKNEELEPGLASTVQEISYMNPSKDDMLENDPIDVPYNAESEEHEDKKCTKVNDDPLAIQSEKEIVAVTQEDKEMQNEAKAVLAESQTKAEEKEMPQLYANEPYNLDTKMDDTAHGAEIIHDNITVQPREIEEMGENKGLSSIHKPVVETSEQNNIEHDLSIHHKAEDEKLESTEDNVVEPEAMQQKSETSNVDTNSDDQLPIISFLTKHETESADDVLQLETEGNAFEKVGENDKTEASNSTSVPETVSSKKEICDTVTGAEGGLTDESFETFDDTKKNLHATSVLTAWNEEIMNEEMEEHKLAVPAHRSIDKNIPKQEMFLSDKALPTEPEEQEDDQTLKEQDQEDIPEPHFGDGQKEVEQDLPVSNFLMNLILGKENYDANVHSEAEAETKQKETRDDNQCLIIPKQEESLVLPPTENNVEDKIDVEQEKKGVNCSEEAHEVVEEQSHDLKLGTETSLGTDAEFHKNSHHLELPPYQDKMRDEISNETLSEQAAEGFATIEAKDVTIPNIKQDDGEVGPVCQENMEATTQIENGSLKNNLDDLNNAKASEEDTPRERQTELLPECLNDNRSDNAVSEQKLQFTESTKSLPSEADSVQNPVHEIQDKTIESSSIEATIIPDIQVDIEEDKMDEKQTATTATGEVAEEHVEISNANPQKSIGPEATSFEQEPQIAEKVSDTEIALGREKENSEDSSSTFMDTKEDSNVSVKGIDTIQTAVEIQADDSNMQINQEKQEAADNKTEMESENLEESNIQEQQGNGTEQKSSTECHEEGQKILAEKETLVKEEDVHGTVKSHTETVNIKSNDEQELSDSKVQESDLSVVSLKGVHESEESFVDITKPEFNTDEEQSPKAEEMDMSEQKIYEGRSKDEEKIKDFNNEEMKTETPAEGQKAAHKKQNLLSGVGSKVKHQLAKVKKAITGKPGRTKPESPK